MRINEQLHPITRFRLNFYGVHHEQINKRVPMKQQSEKQSKLGKTDRTPKDFDGIDVPELPQPGGRPVQHPVS